jgi:hypothetical protein
MKRPSDQVNREELPSSKRQRTAPELFDILPILKKKGDVEFYKERFFNWRRVNNRDDPDQPIAAQRDSWRTLFVLRTRTRWSVFFVVAMLMPKEELPLTTE